MTADITETRGATDRSPKGGLVSLGVWLIAITAVLVAGLTPLSTGELAGSDDYMRFVRVFAWLDGAGWYDQVIARLNAPYGANVPWSRIVDIPLAGIVAVLSPLVGRTDAAMVAATIVPALLLLALMKAAMALSRPAAGGRAALLGAVVVVLLPNLVTAMMPGRVDHHTWQIVLMALALGHLAWAIVDPNRAWPALMAGALFGISLWVGGETVPWLAVANAALALIWILDGNRTARAGWNFALGLGAICFLVFPLARAPALWSAPACDTFSLPSLGLALAVFCFWFVATNLGHRLQHRPGRLIVATGIAVVIGGAWVAAFPSCAAGPYGDIDPRLVDSWLSTIGEAQSLPGYAALRPGTAIAMTLSPLIGCVGAAIAAIQAASRRKRRLWILYGTFVFAGLALAIWQIRVLPFANLFAIAPLTWVVATAWRAIDRKIAKFGRRLAKVAVLLAVGPLGTGFGAFDTFRDRQLAAADDAEPWSTGACDLASVAGVLNTENAGGQPPIIAAPVDLGAELLFRTRHAVIGAPYHRNADGILDSQAIFGATDDARASQIVAERGASVLITCPGIAEMQLYQGGPGTDTFAERLADGDYPAWLRPIDLPTDTGVLMFRATN